jgi:hypothetical protein
MPFAQYSFMSEEEKAQLQHQREVDGMVKEIEQQSAIVMTSLQQWLRQRDYRPQSDKQSRMRDENMRQAMDGLVKARERENALFRELFGIEDDRLAIEGPSR